MLTQADVWQGKIAAHQVRIGALEQRVSQLEQYNQVRDRPRPEGIKDDFAQLCRWQNVSPEMILSKTDDGFRSRRKSVIIQLVKRGWSQSAVAALFDRDVRSIRRLTLKSTWTEGRRK